MRKLLLGMSALLVLGVGVSAAFAAGPSAGTCSDGLIQPGTYNGFTVTGTCFFAGGTVTINGNLVVADGAALNDHAATSATVHVSGSVLVGKGAVLGLGSYGPPNDTTVGGNIVANQPASLYVSRVAIQGNLVSNGGGDPERNFPTKDNTVGGNLIVQGWHGGWLGVIRNVVGGSVIVADNVATDTSQLPGSDSNEVVTNQISGNLICHGNTPIAQIGDSEGEENVVGGKKIGECAEL